MPAGLGSENWFSLTMFIATVKHQNITPHILCVKTQFLVLSVSARLPAGQNADHVVGLVALDADGAVVEVGLRLLVALPDGANLQFTDGLLRRITKTTLWGRDVRIKALPWSFIITRYSVQNRFLITSAVHSVFKEPGYCCLSPVIYSLTHHVNVTVSCIWGKGSRETGFLLGNGDLMAM